MAANPAFMEGVHAAKKGKGIKDNPYRDPIMFTIFDQNKADLWELGLMFGLDQCAS